MSDYATWNKSSKQVENANPFHMFITCFFHVLMPPIGLIHVNESCVFHVLSLLLIHVNKPCVLHWCKSVTSLLWKITLSHHFNSALPHFHLWYISSKVRSPACSINPFAAAAAESPDSCAAETLVSYSSAAEIHRFFCSWDPQIILLLRPSDSLAAETPSPRVYLLALFILEYNMYLLSWIYNMTCIDPLWTRLHIFLY